MGRSRTKWSKHRALLASSSRLVRQALPETRRFTETGFAEMVERYRKVMVKPVAKWGGQGVVQVTRLSSGKIGLHEDNKKKSFDYVQEAYQYLRNKLGSRCIVQQRIPLARVGGRPFDVRVMVQRHAGRQDWKVTGRLAKVAGKGYVVTNMMRSRGKILPLESAVKRSNIHRGKERVASIRRRVDTLALKSTKWLHRYYPSITTVGVDIGIDRKGKAWFIEANFKPMLGLFKYLKDKSMYRRIRSYVKKDGH